MVLKNGLEDLETNTAYKFNRVNDGMLDLEETVEDETSNEAGEEISAKVSDSDAVIESDITKEDQKKESKGFISSIIGLHYLYTWVW